jgi:chromosome segregation ATPase
LNSHLASQSSDHQKLAKLVGKLTQLQLTNQERFAAAEEDLRDMEDEAQAVISERDSGKDEMTQNEAEIEELRRLIVQRRSDLRDKDHRVAQLMDEVALRDNEIDRLQSILGEKDQEVAQLEERMRQLGVASNNHSPALSNLYSAYKGDAVDEQLARYINMMQCQVPIQRLGAGYYIFGTRKIFAKIMNGKLVIRVGGGYMVIEEFIATYADQEMNRIRVLEAQK